MEKSVNKVLSLVEELKNMIIDSDEYKKYNHYKNIVDNDEELKKIISQIKIKQKIIVNKDYRKKVIDKEEFELENLFNKLKNNKDYINYLESSKTLNNLITDIQKNFEAAAQKELGNSFSWNNISPIW